MIRFMRFGKIVNFRDDGVEINEDQDLSSFYGVMVCKLDSPTNVSEFDSQWASHMSGLVSQLSLVNKYIF